MSVQQVEQTQFSPIPRKTSLSVEEFNRNFHAPGRPVIIEKSLDWAALDLWTHAWFKEKLGDMLVELTVNPTHTQKVVSMPLEDYINRIISGKGLEGGLYLDQFPLDKAPILYRYFTFPQYCPREKVVKPHLWIGPGTTVLSLHKDNSNPFAPLDNVFVQVRGHKRVILASPENDEFLYPKPRQDGGAYWHSPVDPINPDLSKFPDFAEAQLQEGIVGPGDVLFIPRDHWHYVRALEPSISMSFWWLPFRLSEVCASIARATELEFTKIKEGGPLIGVEDILEFGGVKKLASALREMVGTIEQQLLKRVLEVADGDASKLIRDAMQSAIRWH